LAPKPRVERKRYAVEPVVTVEEYVALSKVALSKNDRGRNRTDGDPSRDAGDGIIAAGSALTTLVSIGAEAREMESAFVTDNATHRVKGIIPITFCIFHLPKATHARRGISAARV